MEHEIKTLRNMKIPFSIKYRPQIESGEYKVETRDGKHHATDFQFRKWGEMDSVWAYFPGTETWDIYDTEGHVRYDGKDDDSDLFLVTEEDIREEMKAFIDSEKQIVLCSESDGKACIKWDTKSIDSAISLLNDGIEYLEKKKSFRPKDSRYDYAFATRTTENEKLTEFEQYVENLLNLADGEGHARTNVENTKRVAAELLEIAKKELKKTFVLLHKEDHQTAFDLGKAEALKEIFHRTFPIDTPTTIDEYQIKLQENNVSCYNKGFEEGKLVALKDLPRWKRDFNRTPNFRMFPSAIVDKDYYYLEISDLEKLPKED